jgi:hypothetical protein
MNTVWYLQDYNSMKIDKVYTTKKAAFAEAKEYGKGRFKTIIKGSSYWYFTKDDNQDPACSVEKVPLIKAVRSCRQT